MRWPLRVRDRLTEQAERDQIAREFGEDAVDDIIADDERQRLLHEERKERARKEREDLDTVGDDSISINVPDSLVDQLGNESESLSEDDQGESENDDEGYPCDYPYQFDSLDRKCGGRAAIIRPGGRFG